MKLVEELHKIACETSGSHFTITIQRPKYWVLKISRSKIIFKGSFDKVVKNAIAEFEKFRVPTSENDPRNIREPFRYLKNPSGIVVEELLPRVQVNSYELKLEFSIKQGFKNVADCISSMGHKEFRMQFLEYQATI